MGRHHEHTHGSENFHEHPQGNHRRAIHRSLMGVLLLSSSYMVAEILGGIFSGSLALLADAGHMAIDTAAIALSLFASWVAKRPATEGKTYGYYRAEILAALINGATLIAISLWICYEAWNRFQLSQPIRGELMTGVAAGGLVVNLLGLLLIHKHGDHNLNTRGVWLHLLTDTLGSVSAIVAGLLVWKLNWFWADPVISVVISLFILFGAWRLLRECVDVLLEAVPKGVNIAEIKQAIEALPSVKEVHDLHVWTMTSGVPLLTVHV
ncbi:MAG: cation diffusion facilitator family transporter, partial [Deltaproteobacteria bacterium]